MEITVILAFASDAVDVADYVRIGKLVASRLDLVTTDPREAKEEIRKSMTYMVYVDGKAIGFVSYTKRRADHAYLSEIAIEPTYQGRGIGTRALQFVLDELRHVPTIDLVTHPENPAKRLYERFGFRENGVRIENYCNSGEPRVEMVLRRDV